MHALGDDSEGTGKYTDAYGVIEFVTFLDVAKAMQQGLKFYPFYSQAGTGATCAFNVGNDIPGVIVNDFGKTAQFRLTDVDGVPEQRGTVPFAISNPCPGQGAHR
jgi:hypothetical protein